MSVKLVRRTEDGAVREPGGLGVADDGVSGRTAVRSGGRTAGGRSVYALGSVRSEGSSVASFPGDLTSVVSAGRARAPRSGGSGRSRSAGIVAPSTAHSASATADGRTRSAASAAASDAVRSAVRTSSSAASSSAASASDRAVVLDGRGEVDHERGSSGAAYGRRAVPCASVSAVSSFSEDAAVIHEGERAAGRKRSACGECGNGRGG